MDLRTIIHEAGMSARPEYYSGRGATLSDLNTEILYSIHKGIKKQFGDDAALNFVRMVNNIKKMSATTFLTELYGLEYNDWIVIPHKKDASGIAIAKKENGEYDEVSGMLGMISAMTHSGRDDTHSIKGGFVRTFLPENEKIADEDCWIDERSGMMYRNRSGR